MPEKEKAKIKREITVADLYPNLSPEERSEAKYHLLRYLAAVKSVFEQIASDNPAALTELKRRAMLRKLRNASPRRFSSKDI